MSATPYERLAAAFAASDTTPAPISAADALRRLATEHPDAVTALQRLELGFLPVQETGTTTPAAVLSDEDIERLAQAIREDAAAAQLAALLRTDESGDAVLRALATALQGASS